jgi:hypothetical protein
MHIAWTPVCWFFVTPEAIIFGHEQAVLRLVMKLRALDTDKL